MNYRQPRSLDLARHLLLVGVALAMACGPLFVGIVSARQQTAPPAVEQGAFGFALIAPPGATSTTARGINNVGRIVGSFVDGAGTHGFLYANGVFTTIDVPGSAWTIATGINNAGQIVGAHGPGGDAGNHGFLFSGGAFSSFDYPDSLDTIANGINNKGQIVGAFVGADGYRHGFRLSGGSYTLIEAPASQAGSADGINDAGQIVGLSGVGPAATGFVWNGNGTAFVKIQTAPNTFTHVRGVNNLGDVVGQDGGPQAPFRGFLRTAGIGVPIAVPQQAFAWNVHGVNDLGQLVGEFTDQSGRTFGYLATPTVFTAPPAVTDPSGPAIVEALEPAATRSVASGQGLQGPQGPQGPPGPPGPPGPEFAGRGRGPGMSGARGLHQVRSALHRASNALGRGGPNNPFAQRAIAAVGVGIAASDAAIAFVEAHPDALATPAIPPKVTPAFEPPPSERGRYPGRQIPLNVLKDAFERLSAQPGGDLGGARAGMYDAIATAAAETVADIVVTAREDDLKRIAALLQRTAGNLSRTTQGRSVYAQRAASAIQSAVEGIQGAVVFIHEKPGGAMEAPPAVDGSLSLAAGGADNQDPGRNAVLQALRDAQARIASLPGGDFGGLRPRIQQELSVAIAATLADIEAAQLERDLEAAPGAQNENLRRE